MHVDKIQMIKYLLKSYNNSAKFVIFFTKLAPDCPRQNLSGVPMAGSYQQMLIMLWIIFFGCFYYEYN